MNRRRSVFLAITVLLALLVYHLPRPEGLTPEGQRALTVFTVCVFLWATHTLPLPVTGLLVMVLLPLLGVLKSSVAFSLFGNEAVFFILGAFILAAAMMRSGLSSRVAVFFLRWFDQSPRRLVMGVLFTCAVLSCLMPEHAVAALLFPILLEISGNLELERGRSRYGKALFLALAWGCSIGGVTTLLGGARNPLALALLKEHNGASVSFLGWVAAVLPMVVVLWVFALLILLVAFGSDIKDVSRARALLDGKIESMGKLSTSEKRVGLVMLGTILTWIFGGHHLGLANVAMGAAVLLFVVGAIQWRDVESYVNWGVILMYGGAMALGAALTRTHAAEWATISVVERLGASPFLVFVFIMILAGIVTQFMSNAAAVAVVLPVAFGLAEQVGLNPTALTFCVAVPAGLDFCFPMGTPPNAIAYSSGFFRIRDSLTYGLILNLASWVLFLAMTQTVWPLIGINYLAK